MQDKNSKSLFGIDINEYTQDVDFNTLQTQIDFLYLRSSGSGSGRFRVDRKFLEFAKKAREYSIIYRYKDEIEAVNKKIGEAVVKGETSCEYYDILSPLIKSTFEDLGYTIDTDSSSWTDSGYVTHIVW